MGGGGERTSAPILCRWPAVGIGCAIMRTPARRGPSLLAKRPPGQADRPQANLYPSCDITPRHQHAHPHHPIRYSSLDGDQYPVDTYGHGHRPAHHFAEGLVAFS
jgi:hypothetical protein